MELAQRLGRLGTETAFAVAALHDTGASFCTRRHFGRPLKGETGNYIRLAYSGIDTPEIERGLSRLGVWVSAS